MGKRWSCPKSWAGWHGRRWYLRDATGHKQVISGTEAQVTSYLRKVLPAWVEIARKQGDDALAECLVAEARVVGLDLGGPEAVDA